MTDNLREALEDMARCDQWPRFSFDEVQRRARAALAAAPQPAPMDREALVEVIDAHVLNALGETSAEAIADALLARGLRLPAPETMAWAVLGSDGRPMADPIYSERKWVHRLKPYPQARIVRVAIRVVEGGDDAA